MKISILDKIAENVDYSKNFGKMSIWVKICKYFAFGQNCRKITSLVNFYGNLDFGQSLWISRFWSQLSWNLDLGQHFRKILILVNIFGKIDFGRNFPQMLVCVKISEKCRFWSKICKYIDLVKNFQLEFGQICRKPWFWSKLSKISNLVSIYENLELVRVYDNFGFGQNCRKILILVNIFGKFRF